MTNPLLHRLARLCATGAAAAALAVPTVPGGGVGVAPVSAAHGPGLVTPSAQVLVRQRSPLTAYWSTSVAEQHEDGVRVHGRLREGGARRIVLQVRRGDRWVVRARTTTVRGRYRVTVPTSSLGTFTYRLVAPVSARQRRAGLSRAVSTPRSFRVVATGAPAPAPAPVPVPDEGMPATGDALGDPDDYTFITATHARWNPCSTISYRVNTAHGPATALQDTEGAVERIEEATGLDLEYVGPTEIIPQDSSATGYPADTQIVIAWASREQSPMITREDVAGVAGPLGWGGTVEADGTDIVTWRRGTVVLNSAFNWLPPGFGTGTTVGKLLMHEIGHVVGLGHAAGTSQVMYPTLMRGYPSAWGAGDLSGLWRLGADQGCIYNPDGSQPAYRQATVSVVSRLTTDTSQ
jgi:hypothetical protein